MYKQIVINFAIIDKAIKDILSLYDYMENQNNLLHSILPGKAVVYHFFTSLLTHNRNSQLLEVNHLIVGFSCYKTH